MEIKSYDDIENSQLNTSFKYKSTNAKSEKSIKISSNKETNKLKSKAKLLSSK